MFFILSKVLLFFTYPLSWILGCIVLALIFRRKKVAKRLLISAAIIFLIFSNIYLNKVFLKMWEGNNAGLELPIANRGDQPFDAVIILGGYSGWNEMHHVVSFNHSTDRVMEGLRLYHTGSARKIILSGGSGLLLKPEEKESIWMKDYLIKLKVKPEDILLEGESKNTHENAQYTAEMIHDEFGGQGKFLLITSAFHMNRAHGCFIKEGLTVTPYRVDFFVDDDDNHLGTYLLPSALILESWQMLIKEWIGYVVYWMRGYL